MKRPFLLLITIFITNTVFAQTENYKIAIKHFQMSYNAENYGEIFNDFSSDMKQALPLKIRTVLSGLKSQVGKIESKEFISYQQGTYATYKTKFEKAILSVNISLDKDNKINGFFIKPYEEAKTEVNNATKALSGYPEEIAGIIFSTSQHFPNNTQLSIAVIEKGETKYYGIIKENDTVKSMSNQNKVFEIGSMTKVFTSTVLASLVEEGEIKLTDKINAYYPFPFKDSIKISFESLANHTSGLPRLPENLDLSNEANPYKNYGKKELEKYLRDLLKLENEPGKAYVYSNLGVGLLGYTLGLFQKQSFQELLQKRVLDKYAMKNSFVGSRNLGHKLVKGLGSDGRIVSNWDFDVLFSAGGLLSTTEDLAKFAYAQFDQKNKELALTRQATFTVNDHLKIGLGWHILKSENGEKLVWHNGGTGGYSSSMAVNVEAKKAVIILSNVSGINDKIDHLML